MTSGYPLTPDDVSITLAQRLRNFDPAGEKCRNAIRKALDHIYDGQRTGRFSIDQVSKTEATHLGTMVEIYLRRALDGFLGDGETMDFSVAGIDVDCKFSKNRFGWMIPTETVGNYAMVIHANDYECYWHLGFVYVTEDILTKGGNRDRKRSIAKQGRDAIAWCWQEYTLPENTLLTLPTEAVARITSHKHGTQRINELFRVAQRRILTRNVIATVAQQADYMKRVRANGGARTTLAPEGIIILGGDYLNQQKIAQALGISVPEKGEMISVRVSSNCDSSTHNTVSLGAKLWRVATDTDPIEHAPTIPTT
ncbi:MAG: NaeI family type II restriction endonuclease [Corynebacterium sp.]|uniref:NaeI family type II restriction endonuclease n=1 Tax=Corynebacterium sp. TaxID=1720 RepID=UPI0026DA8706|nr:NaeI family type II restriction endonuclease [Corynebacterium sp.]MDO5099366.1 NaeI family type II restriction endonuclease [Corynebacterium sp.]